MKVFFTASYYGKEKYQKYYNLVLNALEKTGVSIISPEKENYKSILPASVKNKLRSEKIIHAEAIKKSILISDAVIIEASHEDFQLGYETAFAVDNKKPLLCLSVNENFSEKMKYRYFSASKYNEYNIEEIVENFIKKVKEEQYLQRFNCFLTKTQIAHLKRKAKLNNTSSSEHLRVLIDQDINE